ncbi:hypothetical protein GP486_004749 [Trichoglossum hirsutum]|uniref:Uncharacterized protein n=1 Tax=Trichoglossum hirsutum TaxID=265104 RepID=A0A9P8LAR7_9PEZI|nr:hypothetical protein GP486_004749 [Trichoglossum hirsutum]
MSRSRILSRLRSRHGNPKKKPERVPRLTIAIRGPSASKALERVSADEIAALQKHMEGLEDIYRKIEGLELPPGVSSEDLKLLTDLVKCAHDISGQPSLKVLLECSPEMQQAERESLYKTIGKLGRYYSASRFLVRAAQKLPIFREIRIETLPPYTRRRPIDDQKISINALLEGLFPALPDSQKRALNTSAYALLRKKHTDADAAVSEPLSHKYLVHAEIQLLNFYALRKGIKAQPRVICASKSACFLCNLFLRFDGRFYIRMTHGRLYEKWMMPSNGPESSALAQRVSRVLGQVQEVLVEEIRKTLQVGRLITEHPNESALALSARWSSPSRSVVRSQKDACMVSTAGNASRKDAAGDPSVDTPGVSLSPYSGHTCRISRASSRTSIGTLTATHPERTTVDQTSNAPTSKQPPETASQQLPLGSSGHPGPKIFTQVAGGDSPDPHSATPVPGSPLSVVGTRELSLRDPLAASSLTLPMRPMDAVNGSESRNIQPTSDISPCGPTASEGDGAVASVSPPEAPLRAPTPPLVQQFAPSTGLANFTKSSQTHAAMKSTLVLPTPPLAVAQSLASTPRQEKAVLLQRGTAVRHELHPSEPELRIHTPRIHATITSDVLSSLHPETGQRCRVLVRYLQPNERPRMSRQGENIVAVKRMERGEERTAGYGAASERTSLYLRNGSDLVEIKYDLEHDMDPGTVSLKNF